jgi:hypothetical protein
MRGLGLTAFLAVLLVVVAEPALAKDEERPLPPPVPVADDDLSAALETGELTEAEYALERARSIFQLGRIRHEFGDVARPASRDATLIMRDLAVQLGQLAGTDRRVAIQLLARPTDGEGVPIGHGYSAPPAQRKFTCGADMCFHWVETTRDAATPAWVATVQATWEDVWSAEIDTLGYRPPRFDGVSDQTDGPTSGDKRKLDVYILDLGADDVFGYCAPLTGNLSTPVYCVVDNDYAPSQYGTSETSEAFLEVTSAHEFHHSSQAAYDFQEDYWLLEGTATNIEETVYPAIDDNVSFLSFWSPLSRPSSPLDRGGVGNSEYGSWIFWRFLQEKIGGDPLILREIWERAEAFDPGGDPPDDYSLQAVRHELTERGLGFADVFATFATTNRLLDYADAEAAGYPHTRLAKTFTVGGGTADTGWSSWRINHLAARFLAFKPAATVPADARLRVVTRLPANGAAATLLVVKTDGSTSTRRLVRSKQGEARGTTQFGFGVVRRIEVVFSNGSTRIGSCWRDLEDPPFYSCFGRPLDDRRRFELRGKLLR